MIKRLLIIVVLVSAGVAFATARFSAPTPPSYRLGLGQMMLLLQPRHEKLWHAGDAENWELAAFYVHELQGSFRQIAKWHPTHEDLPQPPAEMTKAYMEPAFAALDAAIAAKDKAAFANSYDQLTAGCNACHAASDHALIRIQRPSGNSFTNQSFVPSGE